MTRRARVPTILQMEAVECGAAALGMVLAYYGRLVPLDELRTVCGISRDGSRATHLLEAGRRYGLIAQGLKKEPDELRDLVMPVILHWNFNHFVVMEGFGRRHVYLNDPASGSRRVTPHELDESFTGVVLSFEPGAAFTRGGERQTLWSMLHKRLTGSWSGVLFVVMAGVLLLVPGFVIPTFSRVFVDDVLVRGLRQWTEPLLAAMLLTIALLGALTWLQGHYLLRLETRIALASSSQFFWHVLHLPLRFFTQRYAGEVGSRVAINNRIAQLLSGDLATTALSLVLVTCYGALMFRYDVLLTVVGVAGALVNLSALKHASRKRVDMNRRLLRDQGKLTGSTMGGLQSIETLKAMGAETDLLARWCGQHAEVSVTQQALRKQTEMLGVLPPLVLSVTTTGVLVIGGLRVIDGRLSMGMVVAFQAMLAAFIAPVSRLFDLGTALQEARGQLDRVEDVLRATPDRHAQTNLEEAEEDRRAATPKLAGHVEFRRVTFGYSSAEPPLIEDFNLVVRPGRRVALVGGSGSGKTTLAKLACGLYHPDAGTILYDAIPHDELPRRLMVSSFAAVDQEIFLFEGTIRDNLSMWDPTVPESNIVRAARDACVHDDVIARPGGYSSRVDEAGRNFSGGQRQRLEIARALVNNPTILVLDEATSALDPVTEKNIDDNLRRRGCTCLLIAHRLSTIRDCDEIIVLDKGRVVQRGTHDELKALPGTYSRLIGAE